ncbi:MAG: hypothetical protein OEZ43_11485 [Gammaproteobacteria bacterium]|nr:hypothetical protein [Gammaproteobacteria bacterium]
MNSEQQNDKAQNFNQMLVRAIFNTSVAILICIPISFFDYPDYIDSILDSAFFLSWILCGALITTLHFRMKKAKLGWLALSYWSILFILPIFMPFYLPVFFSLIGAQVYNKAKNPLTLGDDETALVPDNSETELTATQDGSSSLTLAWVLLISHFPYLVFLYTFDYSEWNGVFALTTTFCIAAPVTILTIFFLGGNAPQKERGQISFIKLIMLAALIAEVYLSTTGH